MSKKSTKAQIKKERSRTKLKKVLKQKETNDNTAIKT